MSNFFDNDDEDVYYIDDYDDYVIKKEKMNKVKGIGNRYAMFNWINLDVEHIGGEEEVGISRKSYDVAKEDEEYSSCGECINGGKSRMRFNWVSRKTFDDLEEDDEEE